MSLRAELRRREDEFVYVLEGEARLLHADR